jgi:hypothetical protein
MPSNYAKSLISMPVIAVVGLASAYVLVPALIAKDFPEEKLAIFSTLISKHAHQAPGEHLRNPSSPANRPYFVFIVLGVLVLFAALGWHTSEAAEGATGFSTCRDRSWPCGR